MIADELDSEVTDLGYKNGSKEVCTPKGALWSAELLLLRFLSFLEFSQTGFAQTKKIVGAVAGFTADDEVVEHTVFFC